MSDNNKTKINILNRLQTKVNNTNAKVKLDLIGTVLLDKYTINSKMNTVSGEAELYRCTDNNQNEYVVKIYQRENAIKPEIIEKLKSINSPNVAKIIDSGLYENYPFVILPYYSNGSLVEAVLSKGMTFDLDDIKEFVLPSLNNGLKVLHDNGIIHKDLKPSNIMISDDGTNLVIIDFGISSDTNGGTVVVTKTGMTPTYLAPEALSNTYLKETDYYALGITIYELFTGHTPYENLNEDQIASYASIQKIPFSEDFPNDLKNLINGLTYKDLSNRNDKNNLNRRWTYEEVKQWLDSNGIFTLKNLTNLSNDVSSNGSSEKLIQEPNFLYIYKLQEYRDINLLAEQLLLNIEEGKKELVRGELSKKLRQTGEDKLALICDDAETGFLIFNDKIELDKLFISLVYAIAPDLNKIIWNGLSFANLIDYGNALVDEINSNNNFKNQNLINSASELLKNNLLLKYSSKIKDSNIKNAAIDVITTNTQLLHTNPLPPKYQALRLGYLLTGREDFIIGTNVFKTFEDFDLYINSIYINNFKDYYSFVVKNFDEIKNIRLVANSNQKEIIDRCIDRFNNSINLCNKKYLFPNLQCLYAYANGLWINNDLTKVTSFFNEISTELDNILKTLKEKNSSNEIEFIQLIENLKNIKINEIVYIDDKHMFRNLVEFNKFVNELRNNNQAKKFFIENKNKITKFFLKLAKDQQIYFKQQYSEFIFFAVDGDIKVGNTVKFGNYFINNSQTKEPIEWLVLDVSDNSALLITKDAIDCKQYNEDYVYITWENSSLRKWLNHDFLNNAFINEMQKEILMVDLTNSDNSTYGTDAGNNTQDKIFLLSIDELLEFFKDNKDRECKITNYAKLQGAWSNENNFGNCYWWLRSPGGNQSYAAGIFNTGNLDNYGSDVDDNNNSVRPALYVSL